MLFFDFISDLIDRLKSEYAIQIIKDNTGIVDLCLERILLYGDNKVSNNEVYSCLYTLSGIVDIFREENEDDHEIIRNLEETRKLKEIFEEIKEDYAHHRDVNLRDESDLLLSLICFRFD